VTAASKKAPRPAAILRTELPAIFTGRVRAAVSLAQERGVRAESARIVLDAAEEIAAGMASLAVKCLEAFVDPRVRLAVSERAVIRERWPLGVGASLDEDVEKALAEVLHTTDQADGTAAESWKWPAEAALQDVAAWAVTAQPAVGEALQLAAAEDRTPALVRIALDDTTMDIATYLIGLVYLAVREVDQDRARPTIRIGANKYARATIQLMSIGPDLLHRDELRGLAAVEPNHEGGPRLAIVWRGGTQPVQLAIDWPTDLAVAALHGILTNLHEDGLRDWLLLHRMNAEQGGGDVFTWTLDEHCERTIYQRRIAQRNRTLLDVQKEVTERLRLLHRAELRYEQEVPWKGSVAKRWVRIGKHGLIDIPAGIDTFNGAEAARISILPELKGGASANGERGRSFALVSEAALMLSGGDLRLAAVLACERTYSAQETGGVLVRTARYLWETGTLRGGDPAPKRRGEAAAALQRQLDKLAFIGESANWRQIDPGEVVPETRFEIPPPQWWRDQVVHRVPPLLGPSTAGTPRTGVELRAWREARALTQRQAAKLLGVGQATVARAETEGTKPLGDVVRRSLQGILDSSGRLRARG
jgi:hypothetical protein